MINKDYSATDSSTAPPSEPQPLTPPTTPSTKAAISIEPKAESVNDLSLAVSSHQASNSRQTGSLQSASSQSGSAEPALSQPALSQSGASREDTLPTQPQHRIQIEAYWLERKRYLQEIKGIPELKTRYAKALGIYVLRRLLWSFTFFPVFIALWVPFVLSRFNPVAMVSSMLPSLQAFVQADPQAQAATVETLVIAWFSIGFIFAVFDVVLTPFKSPYEYEADVHMRAWESIEIRNKN